jgi:hypothetical protein
LQLPTNHPDNRYSLSVSDGEGVGRVEATGLGTILERVLDEPEEVKSLSWDGADLETGIDP